MVRDYTLEGVQRQLRAMACSLYDVTVIRKTAGSFFKADKDTDWVLGKVAYWKHLNAVPSDPAAIHIRPAKSLSRALIFVDDVSKQGIERLRQERLEPCCIVETHAGCFQLWVDFGPEPMLPRDRAILSKYLQVRAGGDAGGVASLHSGRLCGFTNCKPEYRGMGGPDRFPYVKCSMDSRPLVCSKAQQARAWASTPEADAWVAAHQEAHNEHGIHARKIETGGTDRCQKYSQSSENTVSEQYVRNALENALGVIAGAGSGGRNKAVFVAACRLGGILHLLNEIGLSEEAVVSQLVEQSWTVFGRGWEDPAGEAEKAVRSGLRAGAQRAGSDFAGKHVRQSYRQV